MTQNDWFGIAIILGLIAIALLGGSKNMHPLFTFPVASSTLTQQQNQSIQQQIASDKLQVTNLQQQLQAIEDAKTHSPYFGKVTLQWVSHANTASQEYIGLYENSSATTTVPITGWTIKSKTSGVSVTIPKGTYLIFPATLNSEDPIILTPGDTAYVITGISPNGYSFKVNKCSGYMSQFQNYTPGLYTQCPAPRDEDLSSIPNRVENFPCLDYINGFPTCSIQVTPLPQTYSAECKQFITDKINYGSCINTHKNDANFYQHTWYIYLGRGSTLWLNEREDIVLLDADGKIVSELKY